MRYVMTMVWILGVVLGVNAQRVRLDALDALAQQAGSKTEIDLPQEMLDFAVPLLGEDSREEAARDLVEKLEGVYVRVFEDLTYSIDQLEDVERQLDSDDWSRLVNIDEGSGGDRVGVWLYREGETITGMFVLVAEPAEVVAVNLVGQIDPEDLAKLGAQFGLPVPDTNP